MKAARQKTGLHASRPLQVWDRVVRVLHWTLVAAVTAAWLSTGVPWLGGAPMGWLHQPAGYVALAATLARLLWGILGAGNARFAQFVRPPQATLAYLGLVLRAREPRYIGHNPLGGWMVLVLLACVAGLGLTGWLYTSDWLWGDERVERAHLALAWSLLVLVMLHLAGVIHASLRHRENLVWAMFSGNKRRRATRDGGETP